MGMNQKTIEKAIEVCNLMNKTIDKTLPNKIAKIIKIHAIISVPIYLIQSLFDPMQDPTAYLVLAIITVVVLWSMYIRVNNKLDSPANLWMILLCGVITNIAVCIIGLVVDGIIEFIPDSIPGYEFIYIVVNAVFQYSIFIISGCMFLEVLIKLAKKNQVRTASYIDSAKDVYKENKDVVDEHSENISNFMQNTIANTSTEEIISNELIQENVSSNSIANAEKEYLDEYRLSFEEGGEISIAERRLLNRLSAKLGITDDRAAELEASLAPSLTEDESAYLEEYKLSLEESGGTLSDMDRRLLDRLRGKLDITEERAAEIESLA